MQNSSNKMSSHSALWCWACNVFAVPVVSFTGKEIRSASCAQGIAELLAPPARNCRVEHCIAAAHASLSLAFEGGRGQRTRE